MNHDNAINATSRLELVSAMGKNGRPYTTGTLYLKNDYPVDLGFLSLQDVWAIKNALESTNAKEMFNQE